MYSPLSPSFEPFNGIDNFYASTLPNIIYSPPPIAPSSSGKRSHLTQTLTPKEAPKILNAQEIDSRLSQTRLSRSQPSIPPRAKSTPPLMDTGSPSVTLPLSPPLFVPSSSVRALDFTPPSFIPPESTPPTITIHTPSSSSASSSQTFLSSSTSSSSILSSSSSSTSSSNSTPSSSSSSSSSLLIPVHDPESDMTIYYDPADLPLDRPISPFVLSPAVDFSPLADDPPCESPASESPDGSGLHRSLPSTPLLKQSAATLYQTSPKLSISSPEFIPLPAKPAQWVMQLPDKVPFAHRYTLWFDQPNPGASTAHAYASLQKPICTVSNIRAFWEWTNNLPQAPSLPPRSSYHWMRKDTIPLWEEEANVLGGSLSIHVRPEDTSYAWLRLVLAMMGNSLRLASPDRVAGISIALRKTHSIIHVWNRIADDLDVPQFIASCVSFIPLAGMVVQPFYRMHRDRVKSAENKLQASPAAANPNNLLSPSSSSSPSSHLLSPHTSPSLQAPMPHRHARDPFPPPYHNPPSRPRVVLHQPFASPRSSSSKR